jgi:predicted transcriptional regulator
MARWISIGKGDDQKHVQIDETSAPAPKPLVPGVFDLSSGLPDSYQDLVATIAKIYNSSDDLISSQLAVQKAVEAMHDQFQGDEEAYKELMAAVTHLYQRLIVLQQHLKNLNRLSAKKGVNLKYMTSLLKPIGKQSKYLLEVLQHIPYVGPEDNIAVQKEQFVSSQITQMEEEVQRLRELKYENSARGKISTDWEHLKKGALNKFIDNSTPLPTATAVQPDQPQQ